MDTVEQTAKKIEPHQANTSSRLNWLRAAVLGANDGIVSVAGLVMGVAGATNERSVLLTAGLAGLISGSLSMAAGEYVSVSSQRDTEEALLHKERHELNTMVDQEFEELVSLYEAKGLTQATARQVATELTAKDAFAAHVDVELGINPEELTNPWHAALASAAAFLVGALIPLIAILIPPASSRVIVAVIAVLVALSLTGYMSAKMSGTPVARVVMRVVVGGALAMAITYGIGKLFNVSGL
ncbi:MAG: VIT family protein [Herpetosiphon sp.]|nr:VIT family protein [Herpetosiphon sp.]